MTPERWRQIEDLYHATLQLAPEWRPAFLDRCVPQRFGLAARSGFAPRSGGEGR